MFWQLQVKKRQKKIGENRQFSFELELSFNHLAVKLTVLGLKKKIMTNSVFSGN